jgi:predicted kinase
LAKRLEVERNAIRLSPDDWIEAILAAPGDTRERDRLRDPVENLQWDLAQGYLCKGLTVILENGFWAAEERDLYAIGAWDLGARVELFYLEAPDFDQLWKRIVCRNDDLASKTWTMTKGELQAAWKLFEAPRSDEISFYDDGRAVLEPISDLSQLLSSLAPVLNDGVYVFASLPAGKEIDGLRPIATMPEKEGMTLILPEEEARAAGLEVKFSAAWITLNVDSDLAAVGLTAAVAGALAAACISCNVVSGAFHDHLFVPHGQAEEAMRVLLLMQSRSSNPAMACLPS